MKYVKLLLSVVLFWIPLLMFSQYQPLAKMNKVERSNAETSKLQTGKPPKADLNKIPVWKIAPAKLPVYNSLDDIAGFYIQKNYNANGTSRCPAVTINLGEEPSTVVIENFGGLGKNIKATIDLTTNRISIAPQVVATVSGTDLYLYAFDPEAGTINTKGSLEGSINENGIILGAWGSFAKNASSYLNLYYSSQLLRSNAIMTNVIHPDKTEQECIVYIEQKYDNTLKILNLSNTGAEVVVNLNGDKTFSIQPQPLVSGTEYGTFYCYWTDWSSGQYSPELPIAGVGTKQTLKVGNWGIISAGGKAFIEGYLSSTITLTDEKTEIRYPAVLDANFEGKGTQESPYLIRTIDNLLALQRSVNLIDEKGDGRKYKDKFFRLASDLDMENINSQVLPIGNSLYFSRFAGTFDGNGKTISNLNMESSNIDYYGLFGVIDSAGSVKNLTLENINYKITGNCVGGIAGLSLGVISNCHVTGKVNVKGDKVGGITGELRNTISQCSFIGDLTVPGSVGGIAALAYGNVDQCWARANIVSSYAPNTRYMGGVVGGIFGNKNEAKLTNCYYSGLIVDIVDQLKDNYSIAYQGGVTGLLYETEMNRCFNVGRVIGTAATGETGGVVGMLISSKVSDCYNAGNVINPYAESTGGVAGNSIPFVNNKNSTISRVYNSGNISTKSTSPYKDIIGKMQPEDVLENFYFDKRYYCTATPAGGLTALQMTKSEYMKGFSTNIWRFTYGLYPRLKNLDENDAAYLSAAPLVLADNEFPAKVKTSFSISTDNGISWKILKENDYGTEGYGIDIVGNQVKIKTEFSTDTLYLFNGQNEYKSYVLGIYPKVFEGNGTATSPSLVKTLDDLKILANATVKNIQHFEGEHFLLANDIDAANDETFQGIAASGSPTHYFAGTFDGGNHTIHNFAIKAVAYLGTGKADDKNSRPATGFIGYLSPTGTLKNLTMAKDCTFDLWAFAAPFVGYNGGTVENCRNYADIQGMSSYIGGIVGYSESPLARISRCFNAGNMKSGLNFVGGIAGINFGLIEACQNDGDVLNKEFNVIYGAKKQSDAGGITGGNYGEIYDVLNTGSISSYLNVGGIAGSNNAFNTKGIIQRSVNYGYVNPFTDISSWGSIIGNLSSTTGLKDNYFDQQILVAEGANDAATSGCSGMNTEALTSGVLANLDKANIWELKAGAYPLLKQFKDEPRSIAMSQMFVKFAEGENRLSVKNNATLNENSTLSWELNQAKEFKIENEMLNLDLPENGIVLDTLVASYGDYQKSFYLRAVPPILPGKGTKEYPWLVKTVADMEKITKFSEDKVDFNHEYFRVENDIDFTGVDYKPIAANADILRFKGYFDGNGKKFTNLTYKSPEPLAFTTGRFKGLFGVVGSTGVIANLTIENSSFLAFGYAGSIAGGLYGKIINCVNRAEISTVGGANSAGGLAGQVFAGGSITNSYNYAPVTSNTGTTGGIAGTTDANSLIENCFNSGTIFAAGPNAGTNGGIVGSCGGDIKNCKNEGEINGHDTTIAGIAAKTGVNSNISDCVNKGKVSSEKSSVAGIVYSVGTGSVVRNCVNEGEISSTGSTSGIVGASSAGVLIELCRNTGTVTSTKSYNTAGVLASLVAGTTIQDCWNEASIIGAGTVGGVVGSSSGSSTTTTIVRRCYNKGTVTSTADGAGGVVARFGSRIIADSCFNMADVRALNNAGGVTSSIGDSLTNSWNMGNVIAENSHSGGITALGLGKIINCFNLGDVTVEGNTDENINAGGIIAKTRAILVNCYNMGKVTAYNQAGGLYGQIFDNGAKAEAYQCYNTGKVTITNPEGTAIGNIVGLNPDFLTCEGVYFDKDEATGEYENDKDAKGLTTKEMLSADLGDSWEYAIATYPTLKNFSNVEKANLYATTILLKDGDDVDHVTGNFLVGTPAGVSWTASDHINFDGNDALVDNNVSGTVTLTATAGEYQKQYTLVLNTIQQGIHSEDSSRVVVKRFYYTPGGLKIENPVQGVNIVVTIYDDGVVEKSKILISENSK